MNYTGSSHDVNARRTDIQFEAKRNKIYGADTKASQATLTTGYKLQTFGKKPIGTPQELARKLREYNANSGRTDIVPDCVFCERQEPHGKHHIDRHIGNRCQKCGLPFTPLQSITGTGTGVWHSTCTPIQDEYDIIPAEYVERLLEESAEWEDNEYKLGRVDALRQLMEMVMEDKDG